MKDYKTIWNDLGVTYEGAAHYVCCVLDEDAIRQTFQSWGITIPT